MGILKASLKEYAYYALPILITGFAYGWENGSLGGILAMPRECASVRGSDAVPLLILPTQSFLTTLATPVPSDKAS